MIAFPTDQICDASKRYCRHRRGYREKNRDKLVQYLSDFVVPPVP
jgi:hypothetical protein